jgi:hypothetical protein
VPSNPIIGTPGPIYPTYPPTGPYPTPIYTPQTTLIPYTPIGNPYGPPPPTYVVPSPFTNPWGLVPSSPYMTPDYWNAYAPGLATIMVPVFIPMSYPFGVFMR